MTEGVRRRGSRVLHTTVAAVAMLASSSALAQGEGADDQSDEARPGAAQPAAEEAIVVTGSRLAPSGFTAPTPVTVVGADLVQRQAVTNVSDALNRIPSFRPQGSRATGGVFGNNLGAQTADLRGLGANRTLVLIDGRRVVASTVTGGSFTPGGAVDLSIVPTSILSRAEVVTGGASAAYGSDAVAGVVNLIVDDSIEGVRFQGQTGFSSRGDNREQMVSLAGGTGFADGRGHVVLAGEYINGEGVGDCYTRSYCAQSYAPVQNPVPGANGLPAVVILPNARTVSAAPGGVINAGPLAGTAFDTDGSPVPYPYGTYYGGGLFMSGGSLIDQNPFFQHFPLVVPVERYNIFGNVRYDLTDDIEAFAQASFASLESGSPQSQIRELRLVMQRDNAYLPEAVGARMDEAGVTSFTMGRIGNDFGPTITDSGRETLRIATGLKGDLGNGWNWDAYYQYGQTDYSQVTRNNKINANFARAIDAVVDPASGDIVCRSTLSDPGNGCVPLNIFGEYNWTPEAHAYSFGTASTDIRLSQHVAAVNVSGQPFATWAGPVAVAVGGEYRKDEVSGAVDPISAAQGFYVNNGVAANGSVEVYEAYGEAAVPLAADLPWARLIELNGAARYTHYDTVGGVATWKVGAIYEPVEGIRLRATRSRDIRAPNLFELYTPSTISFAAVRDPVSNTQNLTPIRSGGNLDLEEETADTFTAGVVLQPQGFLDGVRLSVDYFDIEVDDVITALGAQIIANQCALGDDELCTLISRGSDGAIASIDNPLLNLNQLNVRGIDFELLYRLLYGGLLSDAGTLTLQGTATHMMDFATTDISGARIDRAGMVGSPNGQTSGLPVWSFNVSATIEEGPVSFTTQLRYVDSGVYDPTLVGPDDPDYDPSLTNSINIGRIPAEAYVNLQLNWTAIDADGQKVDLYAVVDNLLDNMPPSNTPSAYGPGNPVLYDVVGRSFRLGARVAF